MAFHLEYLINDLESRCSLGGNTVPEAIAAARSIVAGAESSRAQILEAQGGNTGRGQGRTVAGYSRGHAWTLFSADYRPWWAALSEDTRHALLKDPAGRPTGAQVVEICQAGATVVGTHWPSVEEHPDWHLPEDVQAFVRSTIN